MTREELFALNEGDKVFHFYLGVCIVIKTIPDRGVALQPTTDIGRRMTAAAFGMECAVLETIPSAVIKLNVFKTDEEDQ